MGIIIVQCDTCGNFINASEDEYYRDPITGFLCECCLKKKSHRLQDRRAKKILENVIKLFFLRYKRG